MKIQNTRAIFATVRLLCLILAILLSLQFTSTAYAQSAEDECPNPGTSLYNSCVIEINKKLSDCDAAFPARDGAWVECRSRALASIKDTYVTRTNPSSDTNQGGNSTNVFDEENLDCEPENGENLSAENCGILQYIVYGINFLSALAMLAIIGSIMIAGYQYMTARDNSGQTAAAKKRIVWALIALVVFVFGYAFLDFLVPGGLLL